MLSGPRLILRAIERDDLPRYVQWMNDPEVKRHLLPLPPFNFDDEIEWYESQRKDPSALNLAMVLKADNRHIGSVSLNHIDRQSQKAELGIVIGEKAEWYKGYGTEAIRLMVAYGFFTLNLHRIYLIVDADHTAAIRCYQRCGFKEEGRLRQNIYRQGRFEDQLVMGILKPEYREEMNTDYVR